ncbi:hypothetical protein PoHVEF18_001842 [Penicillium ochrochloron]
MSSSGWKYEAREAGLRVWKILQVNWYLGFTAFGGPPVHFKIFYDKYVLKLNWVDEQLYQELFSISQALSGPASTKMLYCVNLIHDGLLGAVLGFITWRYSHKFSMLFMSLARDRKLNTDLKISLPGALGMFGLSIGISNIDESLPRAVYAVLSGLNAATVGIIALAAVELSDKAVTDHLTRILVFLAATAGMLYNALCEGFENQNRYSAQDSEPRTIPYGRRLNFSWKSGAAIIATFSLTFVIIMVLRGVLSQPPLLYKLFANLYLAGTIIFGGGPVVIPLLREYIVAEGWVSPRDFLIGLAVIQACPGPNFNFAVFLGSLTAIHGGYPAITGAVLAFVGIFAPGLILVHGTMGVWGVLRSRRWVKSAVRGINAGAVGLIYTAVYRIWQIGYIDEGFQSGKSLGDDPWWVVVTATSYVDGRYFGIAAPLAILLGAVLGLIRYGVV